ncbi:hypothetical protein XBP1_10015 [Xenorhabdus bovienii str. puntauvense]|uniref:Uncharacterized protein n=1 Tax=Xenorhabdus bovienii str. puntauvense TaxID=1398201 RepID=A0A077NAQ3_XENBV|nr:hypothetical protein XBP1_10015 [Xenorhabdus bovienii str. puntauvense]
MFLERVEISGFSGANRLSRVGRHRTTRFRHLCPLWVGSEQALKTYLFTCQLRIAVERPVLNELVLIARHK